MIPHHFLNLLCFMNNDKEDRNIKLILAIAGLLLKSGGG